MPSLREQAAVLFGVPLDRVDVEDYPPEGLPRLVIVSTPGNEVEGKGSTMTEAVADLRRNLREARHAR